MSNLNIIISLLQIPGAILKSSGPSSFLLTLPVKPHSCPCCKTPTSFIHGYYNQPVKSALFMDMGASLVYRKRRYICPHCRKTFYEDNSFISRYQRMTRSTIEKIVCEHGRLQSSSDIARRYGISPATAHRIFNQISVENRRLSSVISIDEFKGDAGGRKFQVVINDLVSRQCLNILSDRSKDVLPTEVNKYSLSEREKVKYVVTDLSSSFKKLVKDFFPNAKIIADRFHVLRLANDALDNVRRQVQSRLPDRQKKYFKRARFLMLSREKNLKTYEDYLALQVMLNFSDKLSAAYAMKEAFFKILESATEDEFKRRIRIFAAAAEKQNIPAYNKLLKTLRTWKKEIYNAIKYRKYSNGFTEGCNTTIKNLKRVCYSFRNFDNFKRRIIFLLNDPLRKNRRYN